MSSVINRMNFSCRVSSLCRSSRSGIFLPCNSTVLLTTSPSLVTTYFVIAYGEHGSPIDSCPEAIICFFSSIIVCGVGKAGVEISPPGSFFLLLLIRGGGGDVWHSNAVVSNDWLIANAFRT